MSRISILLLPGQLGERSGGLSFPITSDSTSVAKDLTPTNAPSDVSVLAQKLTSILRLSLKDIRLTRATAVKPKDAEWRVGVARLTISTVIPAQVIPSTTLSQCWINTKRLFSIWELFRSFTPSPLLSCSHPNALIVGKPDRVSRK